MSQYGSARGLVDVRGAVALAFGAAQVLWEVDDQEILAEAARKHSRKQQPPMLEPPADGDEGALAGDEITQRAPRLALLRVAIARAHLVRLLSDGRRPGQFRRTRPSSWAMRMESSIRL